jgi:cytoskeleton protein RodZ
MRGVSLDEIAHATKIGTGLLRALEEEQFDLLPGGIFNKGFVRAYAKYLGINEEQAVADYLQAAGEEEPEFRDIAQNQPEIYARNAPEQSSGSGFPLLPIFILLVVVGAAFGGWKLYQQHLSDAVANSASVAGSQAASSTGVSQSRAPQSLTPSTNSSPQPATQTGNPAGRTMGNSDTVAPQAQNATQHSAETKASSADASSTAGKTFQVVLHTTGPSWVSIKADGRIAVRGIVQTDQTKTVQASDEIVVWTGNAGSTQVSFNGNPVPVTGGVNEVKLLVFKPNGLQAAPPARTPVTTEPAAHPASAPGTPPQ